MSGAARRAASFSGVCGGGTGFGNGARERKLPGPSSAPISICTRWIARHDWKPLLCALTPRIAYIATGRPTTVSCRTPQASVHAIGSSIVCSNATCAISSASRVIVSAGTPQRSATASGA